MQLDHNGIAHMSKIDMIKMIRACTPMGLKEAKDAVDNYLLSETLPNEIKSAVYTLKQSMLGTSPFTSQVLSQSEVKRLLGMDF